MKYLSQSLTLLLVLALTAVLTPIRVQAASYDYNINGEMFAAFNPSSYPPSGVPGVPFAGALNISFDLTKAQATADGYTLDFSSDNLNSLAITFNNVNVLTLPAFSFETTANFSLNDDKSRIDRMLINYHNAESPSFSFVLTDAARVFMAHVTDSINNPTFGTPGLTYMAGGSISPTPIPGAIWLLGSGLLGLVGLRRRMQA